MTTAIATLPVDVTANTDSLAKGLEHAVRQVQSSTAQMNRAVAGLDRTGKTFDQIEGGVKRLGATLNDARGALQLFGSAGGSVAASLGPLANIAGGVADAFGSLTSIFRGGAAGFGLSSIVPVLGAVVTAATAAYGAYRLFAGSSDDATDAQKRLDEAMRFAEDRLTTAAEKSRALAEAKRQQVLETLRAAEAAQFEAQVQLQTDLAVRRAAAAEAQRQADAPGRRGTLRQNTGRIAAAGAAADLSEIERAAEAAGRTLAETQARIQAVLNPSADERAGGAGAARGGAAAASLSALDEAMASLRAGAGLTARAMQELLSEGAQVTAQVLPATERMAQQVERLQTLLAAGAITQETYAARVGQLKEQFGGAATKAEDFSKSYSVYADILGRGLGDAAFATDRLDESLGRLAQTLAKQVFNDTVGDLLRTGVRGAIGSVFGGADSGTFSFGKFFSGGGSAGGLKVEARAMGGPVTAGSPYIVGEAGPEWFVPGRSGTVLPNGATPMGGGMTYAPTFNIDARQSRMGPAEFRQIAEVASARAVAEVRDGARRGGAFARDVRGR